MAELRPPGAGNRTNADQPIPGDGDWDAVVRLLYRACLGRDADESGLRSFTSSLAAGAMTPEQMIDQLQHSGEGAAFAQTLAHGSLVSALYDGILRRAPEPGEAAHWRAALDDGLSLISMIEEIDESLEAQHEQLKRIVATRGVAAVLLTEIERTEANHGG